jgi:hypothetical protein
MGYKETPIFDSLFQTLVQYFFTPLPRWQIILVFCIQDLFLLGIGLWNLFRVSDLVLRIWLLVFMVIGLWSLVIGLW